MDSLKKIENVRTLDTISIQRLEDLSVKLLCDIATKAKDKAKQEQQPQEFYQSNTD